MSYLRSVSGLSSMFSLNGITQKTDMGNKPNSETRHQIGVFYFLMLQYKPKETFKDLFDLKGIIPVSNTPMEISDLTIDNLKQLNSLNVHDEKIMRNTIIENENFEEVKIEVQGQELYNDSKPKTPEEDVANNVLESTIRDENSNLLSPMGQRDTYDAFGKMQLNLVSSN